MSNARRRSGGCSRIPKRTSKRAHAAAPPGPAGAAGAGRGRGPAAGRPPPPRPRRRRWPRLAHRGGRVGEGLLRAVGQRRERVPHEVAPFVQGPPGHGQHQLGVGRRAVAVHPELARGDAAAAQGHALGVPERERGVHAPGHEARDRGEADRHPPHAGTGRRRRSSPPPAARRRPRAARSRPRAAPPGHAGGVCRRGRSPRRGAAARARRRPPGPRRAPGPARGRGCPPPRCPPGPRPGASASPWTPRARAPPGSRRGARPRRPGSRCRCRNAPRSAGSRAPAARR